MEKNKSLQGLINTGLIVILENRFFIAEIDTAVVHCIL